MNTTLKCIDDVNDADQRDPITFVHFINRSEGQKCSICKKGTGSNKTDRKQTIMCSVMSDKNLIGVPSGLQ